VAPVSELNEWKACSAPSEVAQMRSAEAPMLAKFGGCYQYAFQHGEKRPIRFDAMRFIRGNFDHMYRAGKAT